MFVPKRCTSAMPDCRRMHTLSTSGCCHVRNGMAFTASCLPLAGWVFRQCITQPTVATHRAVSLQAADFMACKGIRKDIIEYLQNLFIDTMEQSEKQVAASADTVLSQALHHAYAREWRNTLVGTCYTKHGTFCWLATQKTNLR